MYEKELNDALNTKYPVKSLRDFAIVLNDKGLNQQEIYNVFYAYYLKLEEENEYEYVDILGDVMDMISGWYVGKNLNLNNRCT